MQAAMRGETDRPLTPPRRQSPFRRGLDTIIIVCALLLMVPKSAFAQTLIFTDNFNRTTGLGSNWQLQSGSFTTAGTYANSGAPPASGNWARIASTPTTNDYAVSANIVIPAGSSSSGVVARSSTSTAFDRDLYAAQIAANGTLALYRRNAWNWTLLQSVATGIVAGVSYNVRLIAVGSGPVHLEVWLNGAQRIAYDDSSASRLTAGAVGIQNYASGVQYRNSEVDGVFFDPFNRTTGLGSSWSVAYGSFSTNGAYAVSGTPPINGNWASVAPAVASDDDSVSVVLLLPPNSVNSGDVARRNASAFHQTLFPLQLDST